MLLDVYLINHQHDWFSRFAQHPRQFLIDWRQTFLSVDNEKKKITLAERVLGGVSHLPGQFGLAGAENSTGIQSVNGRSERVQVAEIRSRVIPG